MSAPLTKPKSEMRVSAVEEEKAVSDVAPFRT
jgi:hypothetical protein